MTGKNNGQFTVLPAFYDKLNGADYKKYADYVQKMFSRYGSGKEELVLDLACGTGKLTEELCERGYDMIGVDLSAEMLSVAMQNRGDKPILYLLQDMRAFELYGTVSAVVCALDGVNYLTSEEDMVACFKTVRNYLDPGGLFLFDINTPYCFRSVFDGRDVFSEEAGVCLAWRSRLHPKLGICDFYLSLFTEEKNGLYCRYDETQQEKLWEWETVGNSLQKAGMELLTVCSDLEGTEIPLPAEDMACREKWYFVCRCPLDKN